MSTGEKTCILAGTVVLMIAGPAAVTAVIVRLGRWTDIGK